MKQTVEDWRASLGNGSLATIEKDPYHPGAYQVFVDGVPQSHVHLQRPAELFFEYVRRMGNIIDGMFASGEPITALHLGGAGLTLPRYIAVTRPGSQQQVVELERSLIDLVRTYLPLPKQANVRIRYGDAREVLDKLPAGLKGRAQVIIVDIFCAGHTPDHVTTLEFYEKVLSFLSHDGVLLVNVADGPGHRFVRAQVATIASVTGVLACVAEPQVIRGRRFGNFVLAASLAKEGFDKHTLSRLMRLGPHPAQVLIGQELVDFAQHASVSTDQKHVSMEKFEQTVWK